MMCESTPASLALLDALAEPATLLLERNVIPTRAKGTSYFGGTPWHRDSDLPIESIGFAAYLEPLDGDNGALRVLEGSHHDLASSPPAALTEPRSSECGTVVATKPGDVIAFDEHLWHASSGGSRRRQWRVDFVVDPISAHEEELARTFFARMFPPGWDGGYDSVKYPTYGQHWQESGRPWVDRLRQLGAERVAQGQ